MGHGSGWMLPSEGSRDWAWQISVWRATRETFECVQRTYEANGLQGMPKNHRLIEDTCLLWQDLHCRLYNLQNRTQRVSRCSVLLFTRLIEKSLISRVCT